MTIEERFEKIEKQNRNMKKWLAGVAALALVAIVAGTAVWVRAADGTFGTVNANYIYLRDASNRVRVSLSGSSAYVHVLDANGKTRALLSSGGYVTATDSNGVGRVALNGSDGKVYFYNSSAGLVATHP